jgi:aconitate hydratase
MINGLGVVGWGVGGIEAEAVMLGQPVYMLTPEVVGFRLHGKLPEGTTATDLVLTVTQMLRAHGVVEKFVEFFGPGVAALSLPDRATVANMAPEYGATMGFFPVDDVTLAYLRLTGRSEESVALVEAYCKANHLFLTADAPEPVFSSVLDLDLGTVLPSLAGPKRPQDRILLSNMKAQWHKDLVDGFGKPAPSEAVDLNTWAGEGGDASGKAVNPDSQEARSEGLVSVSVDGRNFRMTHGAVVIAAITSCTNTSNPDVMVAAGLVARKARALGLTRKPWVKTSLAPGSKVVTAYLDAAGLTADLDAIGFNTVGYGCTTCIGNSGPLPEAIEQAIKDGDLVAASVLSGNRNFEGRVHPAVRANYLASPPLVVAYALAGTVDLDPATEPLGRGADGKEVFLKDVWPSQQEIRDTVASCISAQQYREKYTSVATGNDKWNAVPTSESELYAWDDDSTYIQNPPFFAGMGREAPGFTPIRGARVLAVLGDSVTTDHISPAGSIAEKSPAGRYLMEKGVTKADFNSYGSRRGNDRVMTRGTFANVRVRNQLAKGVDGKIPEGGWTRDFSQAGKGEVAFIFDAAIHYRDEGTPLVVLAGNDYGMGSSRDWAAKGVYLLGVRAVIAESFERIHRSNLVFMGVLPLQFPTGENAASLGLDGSESFDVVLPDPFVPRRQVAVRATKADGTVVNFDALCRVDTPVEIEYYRNGGILHTVIRKKLVEG